MKINVHTHIFNVRAIFTQEMVRVLLSRLRREQVPSYLSTPLKNFLEQALENGQKDVEMGPRALASILSQISKHREFRALSGSGLGRELSSELDRLIPVLEEGAAIRIVESIFAAIVRSSTRRAERDASERTLIDFIEFLRIMFLPNISAVTDELMAQMGPEDVAVALPMDIITETSSAREKRVYSQQIEQTIAQAIRFPGRLLPFIKVNPRRGDTALSLFEEHTASGACVGVKLYPSLGYDVNSSFMRRIYDLCQHRELPILLHCNQGGFRQSVADGLRCNPSHWIRILEEFPSLKVCFGHFGGDEHFLNDSISTSSWTGTILQMMRDYPGRIFGDVSFHDKWMTDRNATEKYLKNLQAIIADPQTGSQVLWGTDFHLVRMQAEDRNYTALFESRLSRAHMRRISLDNPANFLGLPINGTQASVAIQSHIRFLTGNTGYSAGSPAPWLDDATRASGVNPPPEWTVNRWGASNRLHRFLADILWMPDDMKARTGYRTVIMPQPRQRVANYQKQADHFRELGNLRMGEMTFILSNPGRGRQQEVLIQSFVSNLLNLLPWGKYALAPGVSQSRARQALIRIVSVPQKRVHELADAISENFNLSA